MAHESRIITMEPPGVDRRPPVDWKTYVPVIIAIASLMISGFLGYTNTDKAVASRITAVETQQRNDTGRLDRIENKVDEVLRELRQRSR